MIVTVKKEGRPVGGLDLTPWMNHRIRYDGNGASR